MKQLLAAEDIDEKRWPARVLAGLIDSWKNRGLTPDQVPAGEGASFAGGKGRKLYVAYQERLKTLNAADFGDLLIENIRLFREQPEVLRQYQQRFKFILVDEYQDTNVAQYLWLRLLGQSTAAPSASERQRPGLVLRDAAQRAAPQDEGVDLQRAETLNPHPAEARSAVSKGEAEMPPPRASPRTSAASATTTSRSTAGAGRRSTTSCASTTTSPAPRSSGSSATTARPPTSSPPPRT